MRYCSVSFSVVIKTVGLCKWLLSSLERAVDGIEMYSLGKQNFREVDGLGGVYKFPKDLLMDHLHVFELGCQLGRKTSFLQNWPIEPSGK